jgi:integrase
MIKKSWWVDFRANHTSYRKRSPENSRAGAQAYEATLRHKLACGQPIDFGPPKPELRFEQFASQWFTEYVITNNKFSEQRSKKYILAASLVPFFGKIPLKEITAHDIEKYKAFKIRNGLTNKSLRNQLTVLNKCLSTAHEWDLRSAPPKIVWPKCASFRTDYLSPEECELLVAHAEGVVREMILTGLRTGMRQGELKGLQWSSIDWLNRSVIVRHSRCDYRKEIGPTKNNRERPVPLDTDVYEMLHSRKRSTGYVFLDTDGEPFDHKRLDRRMEKICKEAGLRRITWHILRHTFASHLAMRGVPLHVVQQLLGHAHIGTTVRYAHVAPSALRSAIEMLNPKTMIGTDLGQPVGNRWLEMQQREIAEKYSVSKNL